MQLVECVRITFVIFSCTPLPFCAARNWTQVHHRLRFYAVDTFIVRLDCSNPPPLCLRCTRVGGWPIHALNIHSPQFEEGHSVLSIVEPTERPARLESSVPCSLFRLCGMFVLYVFLSSNCIFLDTVFVKLHSLLSIGLDLFR